jgi:hypothetical protein
VIKLPEAQKGFVLLPRRWVILAGMHFVVFTIWMLGNAATLLPS